MFGTLPGEAKRATPATKQTTRRSSRARCHHLVTLVSERRTSNSAAAELLRFYAFLHPDAIPEELITEGAPYLSPALQTLANDPLKLDEAIGELLNYSLVRRHPEMRSLPKFCPNWRQKYEARKSLSKREQ